MIIVEYVYKGNTPYTPVMQPNLLQAQIDSTSHEIVKMGCGSLMDWLTTKLDNELFTVDCCPFAHI